MTNATNQRAYRERQSALGRAEVRGIYAHRDDHAAVKAAAARINRRRERTDEKRKPAAMTVARK
jgi:hypothetical protein